MESLAQLESKAKVPVSVRERATAYGEKIRKEMKAKPQATRSPGHAAAKSTKPIDVKSSRLPSAAPPPPSLAPAPAPMPPLAPAAPLTRAPAPGATATERLGKAVDHSSFSPTSKIALLDKKGRVMFDGVEFRAVRDLGHMSEEALRYMKNTGKNPHDLTHNPLVGHHHLQKYHRETGAFVAEIPGPKHDITNKVQHPYGNIKGSGLTDEQRIDWNKLRKKFNKERAKQELIRRGVLDE